MVFKRETRTNCVAFFFFEVHVVLNQSDLIRKAVILFVAKYNQKPISPTNMIGKGFILYQIERKFVFSFFFSNCYFLFLIIFFFGKLLNFLFYEVDFYNTATRFFAFSFWFVLYLSLPTFFFRGRKNEYSPQRG